MVIDAYFQSGVPQKSGFGISLLVAWPPWSGLGFVLRSRTVSQTRLRDKSCTLRLARALANRLESLRSEDKLSGAYEGHVVHGPMPEERCPSVPWGLDWGLPFASLGAHLPLAQAP